MISRSRVWDLFLLLTLATGNHGEHIKDDEIPGFNSEYLRQKGANVQGDAPALVAPDRRLRRRRNRGARGSVTQIQQQQVLAARKRGDNNQKSGQKGSSKQKSSSKETSRSCKTILRLKRRQRQHAEWQHARLRGNIFRRKAHHNYEDDDSYYDEDDCKEEVEITRFPTFVPVIASTAPSAAPVAPSVEPSAFPSSSNSPSVSPTTAAPTTSPSSGPTAAPSKAPSSGPTTSPSSGPTASPSRSPSQSPTNQPSAGPTISPTVTGATPMPTTSPSSGPTTSPSKAPSSGPTPSPSSTPSHQPSAGPTLAPSTNAFQFSFNFIATTGSMPTAAQTTVVNSLARLERTITGDLQDVSLSDSFTDCGTIASGMVDDTFLCVNWDSTLIGTNVLGFASPIATRTTASTNPFTPVTGQLSLNPDIANDPAIFALVTEHEVLHVMGIGTLWTDFNLINNPDTASCEYASGTNAASEFQAISGCTGPIPMEPSICGHWDQTCFGGSELMNPTLGAVTPVMSRITVGALEDMGYQVDYTQADALTDANFSPACMCTTTLTSSTNYTPPTLISNEGYLLALRYGLEWLVKMNSDDNLQGGAPNVNYGVETVAVFIRDPVNGQVHDVIVEHK